MPSKWSQVSELCKGCRVCPGGPGSRAARSRTLVSRDRSRVQLDAFGRPEPWYSYVFSPPSMSRRVESTRETTLLIENLSFSTSICENLVLAWYNGVIFSRAPMSHPRTAYELSQSQVATPEPVVSLFWRLAQQHRATLGSVLDMGAGDGRFARGGLFKRYTGVEIDRKRVAVARLPANGKIIHDCIFRHDGSSYDACIGNPPYVRHHDIQTSWKKQTVARLAGELGISLNEKCNLFIYFFFLALLKSRENGLVALVIPYEWVSRPSAKALREFIQRQRWNVSVYRFQMPIFNGVMTTASVSIVDKALHDDRWKYFDITPAYQVVERQGAADSRYGVLAYATRGRIWALRGLSPGSQGIFTLTEGERIRNGLKRRDVVPCVTSLRNIPRLLRTLSWAAFQKHFVHAGEKCWLIRSYESMRSSTLNAYLDHIPKEARQNYTCQNQNPWFNFRPHPVPRMLFSSGFTKFGPKILANRVGARAVGSILGIHGGRKISLRRLQGYLLRINFEKRVIAHAGKLKKVEVKQLNAVLNAFSEKEQKGGPKASRCRKSS
jgi:Eco57I restriction-modification methylase